MYSIFSFFHTELNPVIWILFAHLVLWLILNSCDFLTYLLFDLNVNSFVQSQLFILFWGFVVVSLSHLWCNWLGNTTKIRWSAASKIVICSYFNGSLIELFLCFSKLLYFIFGNHFSHLKLSWLLMDFMIK